MGSVLAPSCSRTREYLTLRTRHRDDGALWVLELSGETDIATLGLLRQELAHLASTNRGEAVVDVAGLEFCDVAAAHLIVIAGRRVPFALRGATGPVTRVLDLLDAIQQQRPPYHLCPVHRGGGKANSSSARPPLPVAARGGTPGQSAGVGDHRGRAQRSAWTSGAAAPPS